MAQETKFTAITHGSADSQLQVFVSRAERTTRVVLAGELDDASAVFVSDQLRQITGTLVGNLVIDIGLLTFIDSTGLSLLVTLHHRVRASGHALTVADPTPKAQHLFQITGLDQVLTLVPAL